MKQYLFSFLLLCSGFISSGQGVVTIKGLIKNAASDSIFISFNNSRLIYEPVEYKVLLDEGKFEYTFKVKEDYTPVMITHGRFKADLLLQPGDDLQLIATIVDTTWTLAYKGIGSDRANYLAKHAAEMGLMDAYPGKMQPLLTKDANVFVAKMDVEEKKELLYIDRNTEGVTADFIRYLQEYYRYFTYFCRFQYPFLHEVAGNKSYNFSKIPKVNYEAVKGIPPVFNDSFISMVPYRLYADQYYRMQLEVAGYFNDSAHAYQMQDSVTVLALKKMPPTTAEYVIALHLYANVRTIPTAMAEGRMADFKKRWPSSPYKKDLEAQYGIAKRLDVGQKAFDFTFTTPQGKTGKLSDFRGKVVLLGFWTSEYAQNISEMRAAAQMANKYKDKDIVFLYVSLDATDPPWIATIEKLKLMGIHTREDGSWKSFLAQIYGVQNLPSFFLIDRDGRFALKKTPYPSQSALMVATADELLARMYIPKEKDKGKEKQK